MFGDFVDLVFLLFSIAMKKHFKHQAGAQGLGGCDQGSMNPEVDPTQPEMIESRGLYNQNPPRNAQPSAPKARESRDNTRNVVHHIERKINLLEMWEAGT